MEPPPPPYYHHHHHNRYVPPLSENPNFYNPHPRNRLPPPPPSAPPQPLPPPPPQLPHHHLSHPPLPPPPAPPPPVPSQSQFSYRPHHYTIQDRLGPRPSPPQFPGQYSSTFIPHHPHPPSPPRDHGLQNRHRSLSFHEESSHFVDRWSDSIPSSRVSTEPPFHHQQRRPLSPIPPPQIDNYINDYDRDFRFRDQGFRDNGNRENPRWGGREDRRLDVPDYVDNDKYRYGSFHNDYERNISPGFERDVRRLNRNVSTAGDSRVIDMVLSPPPRDFALDGRSYESYSGREEDFRQSYSPFRKGHEYLDGDVASSSSHGLRESVDSGYDDGDRLNSKMAGHTVRGFFNRSPRNTQVQKKSALLRLQEGRANNKNTYRNRNHDSSRYSRDHYNESNSSVSGSFRGKKKDDFVNHEGEVGVDREKSPVELDVTFKSNSLVAKAVKAPSSSVRELELKKSGLADSSRIKLNDHPIKASGYSRPSSSSDKFHGKLKSKIVSSKIDTSTGGSDHPPRSYQNGKSSDKKVIYGKADNNTNRHDSLLGINKEMGMLLGKTSSSDNRADIVGESNVGEDPVRSVDSNQCVKRSAPDGVLQKAKKRQSVGKLLQNNASLQSVDGNSELSDPDNSSTGGLSANPLVEDGATHSKEGVSLPEVDVFNGVISSSCGNEIVVKGGNNGAEKDVKENHITISSGLPVPPECSALNVDNIAPNRGPVHLEKLAMKECPSSISDGSLVESRNLSEVLVESKNASHIVDDNSCSPRLEDQLLAKTSLSCGISAGSDVGLSSLKDNFVNDCHIDNSNSDHNTCDVSNLNEGFCQTSESITAVDMDSANAGPENVAVNVPYENEIVKGSADTHLSVSLVASLASPNLEKALVQKVSGNEELSNDSPAYCSTDFANSLENRTSSELGLFNHNSKLSIFDGEATSSGNASGERSPASNISNSPVVGEKRKVTDGQLDTHVMKASKLAGPIVSFVDARDGSSIPQTDNLVSFGTEIVRNNRENLPDKLFFEGGLSISNNLVKGSETHVVSEFDSLLASTSNQYAEPSLNIGEGRTQTTDGIVDSCGDQTILLGTSQSSALLSREISIVEGSHYSDTSRCGLKLDHETSYQLNEEADVKDKTSVVSSSSDLELINSLLAEGCQRNFGPDSEKQFTGDTESRDSLLLVGSSAASTDTPSCATSSTDRQVDFLPDTFPNMGSPEDVSNFGPDMVDNLLSRNQESHSYKGNDNIYTNSTVVEDATSLSVKQFGDSPKVGTKPGDEVSPDPVSESKANSSLNLEPQNANRNSYSSLKKSNVIHNSLNPSNIKAVPGQMSTKYSSTLKVAPLSHVGKPRTWHRHLNASSSVLEFKSQKNYVHSQINSKKDVSMVQNSYVRRGNSLVRKSPQVGTVPHVFPPRPSVYHLNSASNNGKKDGGLDIDMVKLPTSAPLGGPNICSERLNPAPVIGAIKSSSCPSSKPVDLAILSLPAPKNGSPGESSDLIKSAQNMDAKWSSEEDKKSSEADGCETSSSNYLDCQSAGDDGKSGKKMLYLKIKSNQLVAASSTKDVPRVGAESSQALSSDGYFKRRKNQLIRTSPNENVEQKAVICDKSLSSQQQGSPNSFEVRGSCIRQSVAGSTKRKFSLVWTLNGTLSSKKDASFGRWNQVRPYLFPWKRSSTWMNCMNFSSSFSNDSLAICQKLRLLRKREAIYKRSVSGFSLRRSKVLGVGGRNLKWSKSIEKDSRKANTEATLAVAAAEQRKKAQNLAPFTLFKSRNHVSRDRIFRIGSERYKMDPTRRTLQRISDEPNSFPGDQSEKKKRKFYVPRRLLIGNDEYVQIGNGNQLVRDPKRRTRILASEKVRWSLHTARLRLARKKQYCQFFTRFGKCKQDDKKCPYIHDPSKIAVCTKFLNGCCTDPSCKLTHKVIPERMQDCSYFLQGLCSNGNCPYRHVNVNPKSSVCDGFLRGYCADGDEVFRLWFSTLLTC
ncbi:OLC1v1016443C2 [Oldenlandia corymbosa var. corymbosa]|uniref:OLC1v1016443C2 n=1 Tax=Oldenlandia corymbosa var. corymbosa TaxID=529605 RepID=A0AAV1E5P4_OLDCO|nr:OLC1v1016443C2 [Oldenlandia corymbosa var. corymbosa]